MKTVTLEVPEGEMQESLAEGCMVFSPHPIVMSAVLALSEVVAVEAGPTLKPLVEEA